MAAGHPRFAGSLLTRIGDDQQLTLAVTASTRQELHEAVGVVLAEARLRVGENNLRVLETAERVEVAQDIATARAIRAFCKVTGVEVPRAFRAPPSNGHDAQEGTHDADPAGAVHAPADT